MLDVSRISFFLILIVFIPGISQAHIYRYETDPDQKLYIRIIPHPEMKNYYTYGVCKTVPDEENLEEYDHRHEECSTRELFKYWWKLEDVSDPEVVRSEHSYSKPDLTDVLFDDDLARAKLMGLDFLTTTAGALSGAGFAVKLGIKGCLPLIIAGGVGGTAGHYAYDLGTKTLGQRFNQDTYRMTQPYTKYEFWSGRENLKLDSRAAALVSFDDCVQLCQIDPAMAYVNCEKKCEAEGHPEFAVPTVPQFFTFLMAPLLLEADAHEYKRILYDFGVATWPWQDDPVKLEITYVTAETAEYLRQVGTPKFKGECLIGSECDKKYPMRKLPYTGEYPFRKVTKEWVRQQYSPSIVKSLVVPY